MSASRTNARIDRPPQRPEVPLYRDVSGRTGWRDQIKRAASILWNRRSPVRALSAGGPGSPFGGQDPDENAWTRWGGGGKRNTTDKTLEQQEAIQWSTYLYLKSVLARAMHNLTGAYCVGGPITVRATDTRVQKVLDDFTKDPHNKLVLDPIQWFVRHRVYGETFLVADWGEMGRCRLAWWDPEETGRMEWDGNNDAAPDSVVLRNSEPPSRPVNPGAAASRRENSMPHDGTLPTPEDANDGPSRMAAGSGGSEHVYRIVRRRRYEESHLGALAPDGKGIRMADAGLSPELMDGDVFYARANAVVTARGRPDYEEVFHLFDIFDDMTFDAVVRTKMAMTFAWVKTWANKTEAQLKAIAKQEPMPFPGEMLHLNSKMRLDAVSPNLAGGEFEAILRWIKGQGGLSGNFSLAFLGEEGANRATALAQGEPLLVSFELKQAEWVAFIVHVLTAVVDRALFAGRIIDRSVNRSFTVEARPIRVEAYGEKMGAFGGAITALSAASKYVQKEIIELGARQAVLNSGLVTEEQMRAVLKVPTGPIPLPSQTKAAEETAPAEDAEAAPLPMPAEEAPVVEEAPEEVPA